MKCQICNKQVRGSQAFCSHCGFALHANNGTTEKSSVQQSTKTSVKEAIYSYKEIIIVISLVVVFILVFTVIQLLTDNHSNDNTVYHGSHSPTTYYEATASPTVNGADGEDSNDLYVDNNPDFYDTPSPSPTLQQLSFDFDYDESGITDFLNTVFSYSEFEYAEVGRIEDLARFHTGVGYNACVKVKLPNYQAVELYIRFMNSREGDKIALVRVSYGYGDSPNVRACSNAIVKALEIGFCGESHALVHTTQLDKYDKEIRDAHYKGEKTLMDSALTPDVSAGLIIEHDYTYEDWDAYYLVFNSHKYKL